jgi:hypothetical protein
MGVARDREQLLTGGFGGLLAPRYSLKELKCILKLTGKGKKNYLFHQ